MKADPENPTPGAIPADVFSSSPLPRWGVVAGRGRCRVLAYEGNGYFTLLTNRDVKIYTHRDRITFTR